MRLPVMWLCEYLCLPVQFSGENEKETCRKQLLLKKGKRKVVFLKKKYFGLVGLKNVMLVVLLQQCPFERAENPQACHHDLMFAFTFILSQNKTGFTVLKCCRTSCKKVLF